MTDKENTKCSHAILWRGHNYGTVWKVLSQGIHMCNMKVLSRLVWKLCPRLKFFKSRSNWKVKVTRSKFLVPCERSYHKEYTCAILKSCSVCIIASSKNLAMLHALFQYCLARAYRILYKIVQLALSHWHGKSVVFIRVTDLHELVFSFFLKI